MKEAKVLLLFALLLYPTGMLIAQHDSIPKSIKIVRGFYEDISFVVGDFSKLNEVLTQSGFPALEQTYAGIALGISARPSDKDSYFTGKLFFYSTNSAYDPQTDLKGANILYYGLHDEWHLDLVKHNKWRIGPDFGFGFGLVRLKLFEKISTPPNFASTLSPTIVTYHEKKLYSGSLFMDAGAGIDRKFKIGSLDFYFGAGVGYRLNTAASFNEKYQYDISSPSVRLSGLQYKFRLRIEFNNGVNSKKSSYQYRKFY